MMTYIYIYICIRNRVEWLRFWIDSESRCSSSSRFDTECERKQGIKEAECTGAQIQE